MNVIFEALAFMGFLVAFYWLCKLEAYCMYLLAKKSGRTKAKTWREYVEYVNNMEVKL